MNPFKFPATKEITVNLPLKDTRAFLVKAIAGMGKLLPDETLDNNTILLKGKFYYGLQSVPVTVELVKISDSETSIKLKGTSDDFRAVGAKETIYRLENAFQIYCSLNPDRIKEFEASPDFNAYTGFTRRKLFLRVAVFVLLIMIITLLVNHKS